MNAIEFDFPIICFDRDSLRVRKDWDSLVTTTTAGVKNRMFDNILIVDANGTAVRVKSARKLHGVGPFWGYNIFLNRRIRVELVFDGEPFPMSVDDVRRLVLDSFRKWHGWRTRGDFKELKASVQNAQSVGEIIRLVSE